jgi:ribosomal-protein-alanine acetyltransferase
MYTPSLIRHITTDDLDDIVDIEYRCFEQDIAYSKNQLHYLITKAHSTSLLEEMDQRILGFIIILYRRGSGVAGIETINVDPSFQGQGIGKRLLKAGEAKIVEKGFSKIRLEVSAGNKQACALYEKSGFRITALLKHYYKNQHHGTHDAFRMVKQLIT